MTVQMTQQLSNSRNSHATKLILGVDMTVFLTPAPVVVFVVTVLEAVVPVVAALGSPLGSGCGIGLPNFVCSLTT